MKYNLQSDVQIISFDDLTSQMMCLEDAAKADICAFLNSFSQ